jgi:ADP-heptose:LPS heptosyltransferase
MSSTFLNSPMTRWALRSLGMAPLEETLHLNGSLDQVRRLLLVDSGRLCDLVFFLPAINEIKQRWPQVEIQVMVEEDWADLLRKERSLSGLIVYKQSQLRLRSSAFLRLLKEIRSREFDAALLAGEQHDPARDLVAYASGASLRLGTYQEERDSVINCMVRWRGQDRYKIHLARVITGLVGLRYDPETWRFKLRPQELRVAEQMIHFRKPLKEQILIGVDPSQGLTERRFASSNLSYLVNHLVERLRAKVMLFPMDTPKDELEDFRKQIRGEILDLPLKQLRESIALLACCNLFIAGNTELFHVAVAAGVPVIGLFTEADGKRWEPRDRNYVAVIRGRPGESMPLSELNEAVERILHASPA